MEYFLLKQSSSISINKQGMANSKDADICQTDDITPFIEMDYLSNDRLVSDRLKLLLELYLPKNNWRPYVFMDVSKAAQQVFWYLQPDDYNDHKLDFHTDGSICGIHLSTDKVPRIFQVNARRSKPSIIVHLSVAESILRRGIIGLEFVPLQSFVKKE